MDKMTIDEMRGMIGKPFLYIMGSGKNFCGVVAAVSPTVGLSLHATSNFCSDGSDWSDHEDENGTFCLSFLDLELSKKRGTYDEWYAVMQDMLLMIRETGVYDLSVQTADSGRAPVCKF